MSLALGVGAGACGARSELVVGGGASIDAGARDGATRDAGAPEAVTPGCAWSAGVPRAVTAVRAGAQLLGAVRGPGNSVWISWQESLAEPAEFRETMITSVGADGARVFEREGLPRPRLTTGFIGLANTQFNRATDEGAALGWDSERGCSMLRFDANGNRIGAPFDPLAGTLGFPLERCRALLPAGAGWSFLGDEIRAIEGIGMVRRARDGSLVAHTHLFDAGENNPTFARAPFADGSFLLGWYYGTGVRAPGVRLRAFDADGSLLAGGDVLFAPPVPVARLRMTPVNDRVLAAWEVPASAGETTASYRFLDRRGRVEGEVFALGASGADAYGGALSVASTSDGPVLVYATRGPGAGLVVAKLQPDATVGSTTRVLADAGSVTNTVTVPLDEGALVVFEAALAPLARQVYVLTAGCR